MLLETVRVLAMEEEAEEMKPPMSDERLLTNIVEEALSGPSMVRGALMVEEAVERSPARVETPVTLIVPVAVMLATEVMSPEINALP